MCAAKSTVRVSTCAICMTTSDYEDDLLSYGEWMQKQNVQVHYFCLLLSTELPQNGGDSCGILGFLLRDIRNEVNAASKRSCCYCQRRQASIACAQCKKFFHLSCARENLCRLEFSDAFKSYCSECKPLDDYERQLFANPPQHRTCDICLRSITPFIYGNVVYGDCCHKGFAHRVCLQRYANASGYYLRCIWCRAANFRDLIRRQGIFVPDRDAHWEREKNAYAELYRRYMHCDWPTCLCKHGRDFNKALWAIQQCALCASFGAHRQCMAGTNRGIAKQPVKPFKCVTCQNVENNYLASSAANTSNHNDGTAKRLRDNEGNANLDLSFHVVKKQAVAVSAAQTKPASPTLTDETPDSVSSFVTVVNSQPQPTAVAVPTLLTSAMGYFTRPLRLKSSYELTTSTDFFLEIYEFNDSFHCIGSLTLRFKADDARIADKSEDALAQVVLRDTDVYARGADCGLYGELDQIIKEEIEKYGATSLS